MRWNTKIAFLAIVLFCLAPFAWAEPEIYHTPYNPDQCIQGSSGRGTGACACFDVTKTAGRYCDQPVGEPCDTNAQCKKDEFCLYPPKKELLLEVHTAPYLTH